MQIQGTPFISFEYRPQVIASMNQLSIDLSRQFSTETLKFSTWNRLKDYMCCVTPLTQALQGIKGNPLKEIDFQTILLAFFYVSRNHNNYGKSCKIELKRIIAHITKTERKQVIDFLTRASVDKEDLKLLEAILEIFSLEQLLELTGGASLEEVIEERIKYLADASRCHVSTKPSEAKMLGSMLQQFIHNFLRLLEIVLGFKDVSTRQNERYLAIQKIELYIKFICLPLTLFIWINPLFSSVWISAAVGAAVLAGGSGAIYSYFKWLKPCPVQIPENRNLLNEAELGLLNSTIVMTDKIYELYAHIRSSLDSHTKAHILIIGESGTGKTETVEGLAKLIVEEKVKGIKSIFSTNAANLLKNGLEGTSIQCLENILKEVAGYENEVIFIFDEFHAIVTDPALPEIFKTRLLSHNHTAVHCIGITTEEEYQKHIKKNPALGGRFIIIKLLNPNKEILFQILKDYINNLSSPIKFSKKAINKIIEVTNSENFQHAQRAQPARSKNIVEIALMKIRQIHSGFDVHLKVKKGQLDRLIHEFHRNPNKLDINTEEGYAAKQIRDALRTEIDKKELEYKVIRKKLEKLNRLTKRQLDENQQTWKWIEILHQKKGNLARINEIKKKFVLSKFSYQANKDIQKKITRTLPDAYPVKVTEAFVDSILLEEIRINS